MNQERIEKALSLLEQARKLLHNHPNGNVRKSEDYLQETIRYLRESR